MNEPTHTINVELSGVDKATEKLERFIELVKEAKMLADELATVEFEVNVE